MGTEIKNNAISTVVAMLNEQIRELSEELSDIAKAIEELTTVRDLTSGLLDTTDDSPMMEARRLVVGDAVFTHEQRNRAEVYRLMLGGLTSLGDMQKAMGRGEQSVRDLLRGLRDMGLVVKGPNKDGRFYLAGDAVGDEMTHHFTSRQWRWEDAYKLVARGCRTSPELATRFGHGWTNKQCSELLCHLGKLGLVKKLKGNRWVVTSKKAVFFSGNN